MPSLAIAPIVWRIRCCSTVTYCSKVLAPTGSRARNSTTRIHCRVAHKQGHLSSLYPPNVRPSRRRLLPEDLGLCYGAISALPPSLILDRVVPVVCRVRGRLPVRRTVCSRARAAPCSCTKARVGGILSSRGFAFPLNPSAAISSDGGTAPPIASLPAPVHLSDARAVVAWHCPRRHGTVCFRHPDPSFHVSCTISLDASQTKAVFRLRVPVLLKGASRQKPPIFAFISPDSIRTITYESEVPHNVTSVFRSASVGLKFRMDKKVVLVAPSNEPLSPKNEAHGNALNMMQSLAQAAELTIYMSGKDLARSDVDSICAVDWAARGRWLAVPSQADIRTLYRGKGGWIVHPDHLSSTGSRDAQGSGDSLRESPPSYDELALPSPPRPRPAKRRREESQARESDEDKLREMAERIFAERHDRYYETIKEQLLADKDFYKRIVAKHRDNLQH